jgi:hypothetical protein
MVLDNPHVRHAQAKRQDSGSFVEGIQDPPNQSEFRIRQFPKEQDRIFPEIPRIARVADPGNHR